MHRYYRYCDNKAIIPIIDLLLLSHSPIQWVESLANCLQFTKLKPSKSVVLMSNPLQLADPFIHQTFIQQTPERVNSLNILLAKFCYMVCNNILNT